MSEYKRENLDDARTTKSHVFSSIILRIIIIVNNWRDSVLTERKVVCKFLPCQLGKSCQKTQINVSIDGCTLYIKVKLDSMQIKTCVDSTSLPGTCNIVGDRLRKHFSVNF